MANVVDSLVVTLGLNAEAFTKGANDAQNAIADMEKTTKESGGGIESAIGSMGKSVGALVGRFAGLFFAIKSLEDVVHYFKDLSNSLFQLGVDSRNLGIATEELRDWEEVAELAGGSAEDATQSISGLQQAIFNVRFRGQVSESLIMLQRLGVQYMTAGGQMRNFRDIALDTARQLQRQGFDQATRYQYALSAGFTGGLATAVAAGTDEVNKFLATAKGAPQVTKQQTDAAAALQQSFIDLKYHASGASAELLQQVIPALVRFTHALDDATKVITAFAHPIDSLTKLSGAKAVTAAAGNALTGDITGVITSLGTGMGEKLGNQLAARLGLTASERNNNPINLKATGNQARDSAGRAVFPTEAGGEQAALHQIMLDARRGNNTIRGLVTKYAPASDANPTGKYIDFVSKRMGKSADSPLVPNDYPAFIAAMNAFETGKNRLTPASVGANIGIPPAPAALGAAAGATPTPAVSQAPAPPGGAPTASSGGVSVDIGNMTINTQATDAQGIAGAFASSVRRKMVAAQADVVQA